MKDILISVIIPVYNVSEYLDECVESIVNQTYHNLEIILVDDGSTDDSGFKCDEWKNKDARIVVIHKQNGGLSDARNVGVQVSNGEYIGFVDSDDYIDHSFYEVLYTLIKKYDAKIACARWDVDGDESRIGEQMDIPEQTYKEICFNYIDFLENIITHKRAYITPSVWDRLYHRSTIENINFPVGKRYEDIFYTTQCICNAEKIAFIDKALYHYRIREGSITQENYIDRCIATDMYALREEQVEYLENCKYIHTANIYKTKYICELIWFLVTNPYREYDKYLNRLVKKWKLRKWTLIKMYFERDIQRCYIIRALWPLMYRNLLRIKYK